VDVVICNGIESQYFDYLQWKKIQVIDSVIAPVEQALKAFARQELFPGIILRS
jgi:predicted Fe-Mo cluster-binding NifX family protein